ncbi:MAG: HlyD family efflux transporter periplasmic adaptor subunit [Planctomycetales bacterium]|nr:HlyD family efflux transporter periplasmic adaptor subunit [Planctomycetales bacterium]
MRFQSLLIDGARAAFALVILALSVLVFARLGVRQRPRLDRPPAMAMVEVIPAQAKSGEFEFDVDGLVIPFREIDVAAEVGGRVTYKAPICRPGQAVREGELLFRIDKADYQLELDRLREQVEQAAGAREELAVENENALVQIQLAEEEVKIRQRELDRFEKAPNPSVFSQAEIDAAKRNELTARNALQSRKDQLDLLKSRERRITSAERTAQTQLKRAELDLERCEVRARVSGVIVTESVQQEGFVQKGGVLIVIRDTSRMEVRCNLRMQQLQWLWESEQAEPQATSEAPLPAAEAPSRTQQAYQFPRTSAQILYKLNEEQYSWQGELTRYANSGVDQRTRMVPCIVEVDNPEKVVRSDDGTRSISAPPTLLSGMFVTVRIRASLPRPLLALPATAVGPGGDVWLVSADHTLQRVQGEVLHGSATEVLVERTEELADALIVISPLVNPIEGARVRVVGDAPPAEQDVVEGDS